MAKIADRSYFEGGAYTQYRDFPFFQERADRIAQRFPRSRVLIAGCGYGYLIEKLRDRGVEAWGVDSSVYALLRCIDLLPQMTPYIFWGDCLKVTSMVSIADRVAEGRFDLVISEDMLPSCDDDDEVREALIALRSIAPLCVHIVTPTTDQSQQTDRILWHTLEEWRQLVCPDSLWNALSEEVVDGLACHGR